MRTLDRHVITTSLVFTLALVLGLAGCEGPDGPAGPGGADGKDGVDGTDGKDGEDGKNGIGGGLPGYTLSTTCKSCHEDKYKEWKKTGHGNALTKVSGAKPTDPPYTTWPAKPPTDDNGKAYAWTDVSYIIGGFGWRSVFVDAKGYVIPGAKAAYQVNAANWGPYETSKTPGTMKFTCPECHTTRWRSFEEHEVERSSADLEGAGGKWLEDGVACERCHGAGGNHKPGEFEGMTINRNSSMCGKCHGHKPLATLKADNGLLAQGQQYNEISATKMKMVQCVDCHDPHRSARWDNDPQKPPIVTTCESCHYKLVKKQKVAKHLLPSNAGPTCVTCHMPNAVKSAIGNPTYWTGDLRSHLFRINTDTTAPAVSKDGKTFMPYLTINFACRQCHSDPTAKSDALLQTNATGYHD